jgi:hypothetical protein
MEEIKQMAEELAPVEPMTLNGSQHILTPAVTYFAFYAPFDDSDGFVQSKNCSFAKSD